MILPPPFTKQNRRRGAPVFALSFTAAPLLQGGADGGQQVAVVLEGGQVRVVLLDLVGTAEEKAGLAVEDHLQIVIAVAAGDGVVADRLKGLDGGELGVFTAHKVAGDVALAVHLEVLHSRVG